MNKNENTNRRKMSPHRHGESSSSPLPAPVTPVGITIARKRKNSKSLKKEEQKPKAITSTSDNNNKGSASTTTRQRKAFRNELSSESDSPSTLSKSKSSYQKPVSSWSIFWEGSALYATCLIVPTVIACILRHHEYLISISSSSTSAGQQQPSITLLDTTLDLAYTLAVEYIWTEPVRATAAYYLCPAENGPLVPYLGADYMPTWSWCPKPPELDDANGRNVLLLVSPDAAWTDLRLVAVLSLTMALIRIAIVRAVLGSSNFKDSTRMRALIKCKSSHLLSSNYELTPCGTPVLIRKVFEPTTTTTISTASNMDTAVSSSSPSLCRNLSSLQLPFPPSLKHQGGFLPGDDQRGNDDGRDADDADDDSVNVGLFLDTSEQSLSRFRVPALSRRVLSNKDMLPSIPPTPPLSPANNTAANADAATTTSFTDSATQSQPVLQPPPLESPDSPLDYLTNSLLRRCNSTGSGTGGIQGLLETSSHRRLFPSTTATTTPVSPMVSSSNRAMSTRSRPRHLYAAPRLATAVFRLAYSTAAAVLAWHSFHTASFWPWYVGGAWNNNNNNSSSNGRGIRSSTAHCWDLNGNVGLGILDSDFDLRNTVLRRYFLLQASYHFHSTAFHVGSCILLMIQNYRSNKDAANPQSPANTSSSSSTSIWRVSTTSYLRSLLHHALALLTIATAYIFSSLRRLVAIGMFAFDVSSWFLHVLQICINAKNYKDDDDDDDDDNDNKKDGRFSLRHLLTATNIQFFHRFLVLPSFVICRFGVWGALWYSALTESRAWLQQLEKTLFPNAALLLQSVWNACMAGLFAANIIHLYRLLYHPHLKRILRNK
jgi:hypothetical protein